MATEKQMKYITWLNKQLGRTTDEKALKDLAPSEASELIDKALDELEQRNGNHNKQAGTAETSQPDNNGAGQQDRINKVRLGLAMKLVIQGTSPQHWRAKKQEFKKTVAELYQLLEETEAHIARSLPPPGEQRRMPVRYAPHGTR